MNPRWCVRTSRLVLRPVGGGDLADLVALKADPRVFAGMLGGVRNAVQVQYDLAADIQAWGAHGFGIWTVRSAYGFEGVAGLQHRADGRGVGIRFAFWPESRGRGLAREAAGAVLGYAHGAAGLARVVAVARADNFASRTVLGAIGMRMTEQFTRQGFAMIGYDSIRPADAAPWLSEGRS